jgi:hypothetical protein
MISNKSLLILLPMIALGLAGCANEQTEHAATGSDHAATEASSDEGGAQLWAANCSRCHNIRPPQSFSDAQWQTIVHHMRLRANLTGEETRKITEFLQSSD